MKARGEGRTVWKIPFRDEYRRRSFRTMKSALEDIGFEELRDEPFERSVRIWYEVNGELCSRIVSTRDTALSACLPPSIVLQEDSLKGERRVTFVYWGRGRFKVFLPEDAEDDEVRVLTKIIHDFVQPLYTTAFAGRLSEPQTRRMVEFSAEKLSGEVELGEGENKIQTITEEKETMPMIKEMIPDEVQPPEPPPAPTGCLIPPPAETTPRLEEFELEKKLISIEEMKKEIAEYHPITFRERAAYERYQQALTKLWTRRCENEIHKLFHSLIRGRRKPEDFEHYYNQLYRLAPEWLEARIRPRRKFAERKDT